MAKTRVTKDQWHVLSELNTEEMTAVCSIDGPVKVVCKGKSKQGQQRYACRIVASANRGQREYQQEWWLLRRYGLTPQDYAILLAGQGGGCAICGEECPRYGRLSVDHDHGNGRVRGLLCDRCNRGIGYFSESPERLRAAAAYLLEER